MSNSTEVENHIYRPVCLPPQTVRALGSLGKKKNACDLFTTVNMYPTEEALKNIYEMTFETNKNNSIYVFTTFSPSTVVKPVSFIQKSPFQVWVFRISKSGQNPGVWFHSI